MFELRVTVTGEVLQWQWRVPPEKEVEPGVMPALMRGCRLKDIVNLGSYVFFVGVWCLERGLWQKFGRGRSGWNCREGNCWFYLRARMRLPSGCRCTLS
jgi:hypothetical protein